MRAASTYATARLRSCSARKVLSRTCWASGAFSPSPERAVSPIESFRLGRCLPDRRRLPRRRGLHVDRLVRLRLGLEVLHRIARGGERLSVEMAGDFVAFAGGVLIALAGGEREPFVGLGVVLLHADAARIKNAEIVLAVAQPVIGAAAEPLGGGGVIRRAVDAFGVKHRKIVHGLAVALLGGRQIELARAGEILFDADAFFIEAAKAELCRRQTLLGGALQPMRGRGAVFRNAAAFGKAGRNLIGGSRIAADSRRAQRRIADRFRQIVVARCGNRRSGARLLGGSDAARQRAGDVGRSPQRQRIGTRLSAGRRRRIGNGFAAVVLLQ